VQVGKKKYYIKGIGDRLSERELIKYIIKHLTKRKRRKNVVKKDGIPLSQGPAYTGTSSNVIRHVNVGDREQNELMKQLVNSQIKALEAPKVESKSNVNEVKQLEDQNIQLLENPFIKQLEGSKDEPIYKVKDKKGYRYFKGNEIENLISQGLIELDKLEKKVEKEKKNAKEHKEKLIKTKKEKKEIEKKGKLKEIDKQITFELFNQKTKDIIAPF